MKPWLGAAEAEAVAELIASGPVVQGLLVARFEEAFAARQQASYAVAVPNGTTAVHLALTVAGIGPSDDVVVPSLSSIETANAVTCAGATPLFADVEVDTGNVSARTLAAALTSNTRAVIVADQCGMPVDLVPIRYLCDGLGITVIEDAGCGAGSTYRGGPVGAGAELAAWSFHHRNILTTGEGGMLTTTNEAWAVRALQEHAMSVSANHRPASLLAAPEEYGGAAFTNGMTDLQAAVGLVQLGRLDEAVSRRRAITDGYRRALAGVEGLRFSQDPLYGTSNFQSFWFEVLPDFPLGREELLERLAQDSISARRGIMAAHRQPAYAGRDNGGADLSVTERLADHTVILPVYHQLTLDEQSRVIRSILGAAGKSDD